MAKVPDEAEIAHLHVSTDKKEVAWLDVQVLKAELACNEVKRLCSVAQVPEKLRTWNSISSFRSTFPESVQQGLVCQLADSDELSVDDFDTLKGQNEGVPNLLDPVEGFEFLACLPTAKVSVDEFDCFQQAARGLGLPDLTKASRP
jgi:hypothetical protein